MSRDLPDTLPQQPEATLEDGNIINSAHGHDEPIELTDAVPCGESTGEDSSAEQLPDATCPETSTPDKLYAQASTPDELYAQASTPDELYAEGTAEPWAPPPPPAVLAEPNSSASSDANGSEPPNPPVPPALNSSEEPADEAPDDASADETKPMTLTEHLGELRIRLVRCLIGAGLGFMLCYGVSEQLFMWLAQPLAAVMPTDTRLIYTSVPEGFFVYLKVAFVAGVFVASPYIFYQIWAFIAPGLYREERQQIMPLALCSALFFVLGASFCYFLVFPYAFTFFMSYSNDMIVAMPSINEYLGFSLKMILAFGLIFEMPLFAFFLARMGLVTAGWMRKVRRYAVLVVFVVAAILTPPDVFSQLLMAVPMIVLYEISILVAAAVGRKDSPANESPKATEQA